MNGLDTHEKRVLHGLHLVSSMSWCLVILKYGCAQHGKYSTRWLSHNHTNHDGQACIPKLLMLLTEDANHAHFCAMYLTPLVFFAIKFVSMIHT